MFYIQIRVVYNKSIIWWLRRQYGWILHSCAVFSLACGSWKYGRTLVQYPAILPSQPSNNIYISQCLSCILAEKFSKLSCNHGNYHLVIMHQLHNYVYFVMSCLLWSYWSRCTLLGKYRVVNLHISPNCRYIPSSISESHGSPKTNFTALKEEAPKNI